MTRPLDRNARLPQLGQVDSEAGEFWVENPFLMPGSGMNLSAYERNRLFLSLQGVAYIDASFAARADIEADSRSVVAADFDRDGAEDLLVGSVGGGPLRLFLNRFDRAARVRIELVGVESNRAAIGSRVVAEVGGRRIVRDLFAPNGGTGQAPPELLIGLGQARQIDRLSVRWPSGRTQQFEKLPVNRRIRITEGKARPVIASLAPTPP